MDRQSDNEVAGFVARWWAHSSRPRAVLLGAVAVVGVIAAGIPVGASLMTPSSDGGPATQTFEPTLPSVSAPAPTTPSIEATPSETQAPATTPAVDTAPPCLDAA